jgi:uncharacterized protein YjcR
MNNTESKLAATPRRRFAAELRLSGLTYKEIGEKLGVSVERARQLANHEEWTKQRHAAKLRRR